MRAYEVGIVERVIRKLRERNDINGKKKELVGAIYNLRSSRNIVRDMKSRTRWTDLAHTLGDLKHAYKNFAPIGEARSHRCTHKHKHTHIYTHIYESFILRWILR